MATKLRFTLNKQWPRVLFTSLGWRASCSLSRIKKRSWHCDTCPCNIQGWLLQYALLKSTLGVYRNFYWYKIRGMLTGVGHTVLFHLHQLSVGFHAQIQVQVLVFKVLYCFRPLSPKDSYEPTNHYEYSGALTLDDPVV